jgi:hypothetical protein
MKTGPLKEGSSLSRAESLPDANGRVMLPSQTLEGWKIQDEQPLRSQDLIALPESSLVADSCLAEDIEADDDIDRLWAYGHLVHRGLN